eukprot:389120-Pleurochrysis_carterae.AAC.1
MLLHVRAVSGGVLFAMEEAASYWCVLAHFAQGLSFPSFHRLPPPSLPSTLQQASSLSSSQFLHHVHLLCFSVEHSLVVIVPLKSFSLLLQPPPSTTSLRRLLRFLLLVLPLSAPLTF